MTTIQRPLPHDPHGALLLAIPNFSDGRAPETIAAIGQSLAARTAVRLLDVHADSDHNRSVFTLSGSQAELVDALVAGAATALERIEIGSQAGQHPRVGALDVAPIVHLTNDTRGAACAAALTLADRLADELDLPVFLYGELTSGNTTRANLRRGGHRALARRISDGELQPDFGPRALHPSGGAVLVASRPPLIAFNVELAPPAGLPEAIEVAAAIREGGRAGLPGVRAIAVELTGPERVAQVSTNIEDFSQASPADVVAAISRLAPVSAAEIVGLPPREAFADFPAGLPLRNARFLEDVLAQFQPRSSATND